jgi:NAD(P)-dependent dehydrogenase (short-subunit alcohol dehydrogenase family)
MSGPRLEGKVAIVTGAGSRAEGIGNGRAAAILFAASTMARQSSPLVTSAAWIAASPPSAAIISRVARAAASSMSTRRTRAPSRALSRWGRLDILDNNVGIGGAGSVVQVPIEDWERILRVNVLGMVNASKHAIPAMIASGGGSIINISSISALRPRGLTPYSTSKGAVIALTRAMAVDHARDGIRVNCIAPGPVYTPMVSAGGMTEEVRERRKNASPLRIEGTGWDVGYAALFLASDEARYISGVVLPVDGGVTIVAPSR